MLILVAVTISMAVNGGLFDYAGKAVGETKNAINVEQQLANGGVTIGGTYYNSIDEYLNKDSGTTLISLYKSGELKVGDYVDYNPSTEVTTVNPDNPENAENIETGALTGYTDTAQSVAQEKLTWRVLGTDGNNLLLISTTPTNAGLKFYGHIGYNNYENVLNNTCNILYGNSTIGVTARSINMNDIDTYLGGSAFDKKEYSNLSFPYGYSDEFSNIYTPDNWEATNTKILTNTAYGYSVGDVITDETNLDLLVGTEEKCPSGPYYYLIASRSVNIANYGSSWCYSRVYNGVNVRSNEPLCYAASGVEHDAISCIRPIVSIPYNVTTEQVPVLETEPTVIWDDPLGIYSGEW